MAHKKMKWHEAPFTLLAVQCNYGWDSRDNLRYAKKNGFDGEQLLHLLADGHIGYYTDATDSAKLDAYLAHSRTAGLRQIVYFNAHCITQEMRERHPDWTQRDKDGNDIAAYGTFYLNCIRGGWFDDFFKGNIAALARHDIEGIFLDGPLISPDGCFCAACRQRFMKRYGIPMDKGTAEQRLRFNVETVTEYMKKAHRIIKAANPDILLYVNNSALRADVTGSNTRKIEPYVDMLGAEGGFVWVNKNTSLWPISPEAKILETQARGKPTVIFIAGDYKPHSYYMHTAAETTIYYAQALANGANVWYGIHGPVTQGDTPGGRAATAFNAFLRKHRKYYTQTRSVANVALMWSQDTANFYASTVSVSDFTADKKIGAERPGDHTAAFMGFHEVLQRAHIQHDILDEASLTDGSLQKYDLLILPTVACLGAKNAAAIKAFVKDGGNLITTLDTGFYNEDGTPLPSPRLLDLQGVKKIDGIINAPPGCCYQRMTADGFADFAQPHIPAPTRIVALTPADTAT
ncbi:MAG: beta-galactosidase trimerization domain-containing protein, partial [Kiritimatiellaeota bacterium]|nr:beta-galactosidase trimerization domain-containing protein [Kiritimatiellota bacterium]